MIAIIVYAAVVTCAFSSGTYIAFTFANEGRKSTMQWYNVAFPLVILGMIALLSYLGWGVVAGVVTAAMR